MLSPLHHIPPLIDSSRQVPQPPEEPPSRNVLCLFRGDPQTIYNRNKRYVRLCLFSTITFVTVIILTLAILFVSLRLRRRPLSPESLTTRQPSSRIPQTYVFPERLLPLAPSKSGCPSQKQVIERARNVTEVRVMADIKVDKPVRAALLQVTAEAISQYESFAHVADALLQSLEAHSEWTLRTWNVIVGRQDGFADFIWCHGEVGHFKLLFDRLLVVICPR